MPKYKEENKSTKSFSEFFHLMKLILPYSTSPHPKGGFLKSFSRASVGCFASAKKNTPFGFRAFRFGQG
jgi:hypothetical protein